MCHFTHLIWYGCIKFLYIIRDLYNEWLIFVDNVRLFDTMQACVRAIFFAELPSAGVSSGNNVWLHAAGIFLDVGNHL